MELLKKLLEIVPLKYTFRLFTFIKRGLAKGFQKILKYNSAFSSYVLTYFTLMTMEQQ